MVRPYLNTFKAGRAVAQAGRTGGVKVGKY